MITKTLEVSVKAGEKEFTGSGTVELYSTAEDILSAMDEKSETGENTGLDELLSLINFSLEAKKRASIRQKVANEAAGPEKAIEKAASQLVKAFAAMGQTLTEEAAVAMVQKQLASAQSN